MSETITAPEAKETKTYNTVAEYLSAYEESDVFQEALEERRKILETEHPNVHLDSKTVRLSMLKSFDYGIALNKYYLRGNHINGNINLYDPKSREAIVNYWHALADWPRQARQIHENAFDISDEIRKLHKKENERERLHTKAGLALLEQGIKLKNGNRITHPTSSPNKNELSPEEYAVVGRTLVTIISAENGKDEISEDREKRKILNRAQIVFGGLQFKNGEWQEVGEI